MIQAKGLRNWRIFWAKSPCKLRRNWERKFISKIEKPSVYHMLPHDSPVLRHVTPWVEYVFL